jgi:hypothetical protein
VAKNVKSLKSKIGYMSDKQGIDFTKHFFTAHHVWQKIAVQFLRQSSLKLCSQVCQLMTKNLPNLFPVHHQPFAKKVSNFFEQKKAQKCG